MTDENKDGLNEQQTFLNGHEELLESINTTSLPDGQSDHTEPAEETPVSETEPQAETPPETIAPVSPVDKTGKSESKKPTAPKTSGPNKLGGKKKKKQHPKHQHSPQHEDLLKKQALEQQEVKEVLVFIKKYTKPAVIVIVVICAVILVDKFFKAQRYKQEAIADTALIHAQSAEDLELIINDYASTPSAPLALMGLAREKFNTGQFDEAEVLYTQFSKKHAHHELAIQADLNLISCKEAKGQLGEAHLLYGQFAKKHKGSYLVPSALMGQARCLEVLGELGEAQIAYEDIMVNFPGSSWAQIAEVNLKVVLGKKK